MSSLETIAEAKIRSALDRRLLALTYSILSEKQQMNSRNLLHSTMTVQGIHRKCIALFDQVRDDIKAEYAIVLDETLWPTDKLSSRLMLKANQHLEIVAARAQSEITEASQSLLNSGMHNALNKDIPLARDRAFTGISLFVDGCKKVKLNRSIKAVVLFLPKLVARLWALKARES